MGWLSDFFSDPASTSWNTFEMLPGSPEASLQAFYSGVNGDLSWNPYGQDNSVWDYGAGGSELSQDPRNRQTGRMIGTAIGSYFTGGALGSAMGSSVGGAAASGAGWGAAQAAGSGGDWKDGAVKGAVGGAVSAGATNADFVGGSGMDFGAYNEAVNRGVGSTLGGLARGQNYRDAVVGGLTTGATSGLSTYFAPEQSYGGQSYPSNYQPQATQWDSLITGQPAPQMSYAPPTSTANPDFSFFDANGAWAPNREQPQSAVGPQTQALNAPQFGSKDWFGSNAGNIASTLFSLYNLNKQRRQVGDYLGGLQGLYRPNSAYAQQLRKQLEAKDAATGRRSQYGPREVELQARLAEKANGIAPTMLQGQLAKNNIQNKMFSNLVNGGNQMGLWKGILDLYNGD